MKAPTRFGVAGAGAIASTYVTAFDPLAARVVAVADLDRDAAEALARPLSARAFESAEEMARHGGIDAAIVCTPPSTHAEVSAAFTTRGIPVLCEKPLAPNLAEAAGMLENARRAGTLLAVSSKFRHCADVVRAKEILDKGTIGRPLLAEITFTSKIDMTNRWNSNPRLSGGGVLIDNGTHAADLLIYTLGPIAEVAAVEGIRRQSTEVEDTASLFARSAGGAEARCELSWSIRTENPVFFRLIGTAGSVEVGWRSSVLRHGTAPPSVFGQGYDKIACFRSQIENFRGAVAGTDSLRIGAGDALAAVEIIAVAYDALRTRRLVPGAGHSGLFGESFERPSDRAHRRRGLDRPGHFRLGPRPPAPRRGRRPRLHHRRKELHRRRRSNRRSREDQRVRLSLHRSDARNRRDGQRRNHLHERSQSPRHDAGSRPCAHPRRIATRVRRPSAKERRSAPDASSAAESRSEDLRWSGWARS